MEKTHNIKLLIDFLIENNIYKKEALRKLLNPVIEEIRKQHFAIDLLQNIIDNNNYTLEHNLQVLVYRAVREFYPHMLIFSVPNGGRRNKLEMIALKSEGLNPGVSDLIILDKFPKAYFIEMKASNGKVSEAQEKFSRDLARLGWNYYLIKKGK